MKVRELIAFLQMLDGDMRVLIQGYETGYDDVYLKSITYSRSTYFRGYDGTYMDSDDGNTAIALVRGEIDE